jgi:anti-sigma factor RsiW
MVDPNLIVANGWSIRDNVLMLSVETPVDEKKRARGHYRAPSSTGAVTSPRSQATHVDERVIGRNINFGDETYVGTLSRGTHHSCLYLSTIPIQVSDLP